MTADQREAQLTKLEASILAQVRKKAGLTCAEYAARADTAFNHARRCLYHLVELGLLGRQDPLEPGSAVHTFIPAKPRAAAAAPSPSPTIADELLPEASTHD